MSDPAGLAASAFTSQPACFLAWPAAAMVLGALMGTLLPRLAQSLAIVPRTAGGLAGIATAPFVHFGMAHLAANLPPFLVLGYLVLHRAPAAFVWTAAGIAAAQGLLLWLLGRRAAHAGMSGVVFGFFGYLLAVAWIARDPGDLAVGACVLLFYGGMLAGIAPARNGTSWEGHLFGLLAGAGAAWLQFG